MYVIKWILTNYVNFTLETGVITFRNVALQNIYMIDSINSVGKCFDFYLHTVNLYVLSGKRKLIKEDGKDSKYKIWIPSSYTLPSKVQTCNRFNF